MMRWSSGHFHARLDQWLQQFIWSPVVPFHMEPGPDLQGDFNRLPLPSLCAWIVIGACPRTWRRSIGPASEPGSNDAVRSFFGRRQTAVLLRSRASSPLPEPLQPTLLGPFSHLHALCFKIKVRYGWIRTLGKRLLNHVGIA